MLSKERLHTDVDGIGLNPPANPPKVAAHPVNTWPVNTSIDEWGGVDTQKLLPYGSPQEVADGVKRLIDIMAPGGGFILATVHNVRPEVPPENLIALFDTALEYGR